MNLRRITERVWLSDFEKERDRPGIGYVLGDRWKLCVDAGHSGMHTMEFYAALKDAGLPPPDLTVLTHWHWDHTFGMHAVHGMTIASTTTADHLRQIKNEIEQDGPEQFFQMDESIRLEYAGTRDVVVTLPDLLFEGEMQLDLGNCPVRLFRCESPHTDDCTLVHVLREKVLFLGDAAGGVFPTWEKDPVMAFRLAHAIEGLDAEICIRSHYPPEAKQALLDDLYATTSPKKPDTSKT